MNALTRQELSKQRKVVETLQLKHYPAAANLKKQALSGTLISALETLGEERGHTLEEVAQAAAATISFQSLPIDIVLDSLRLLANVGLVAESDECWSLTPRGRTQAEEARAKTARQLEAVIARHFPGAVPHDTMCRWIRVAGSVFFEELGSRWFREFVDGSDPPTAVEGVLHKAVDRANAQTELTDSDGALERGLEAFLVSKNPDDVAQMWSFGQAAFAARLIVAELGPEVAIVDELRGATLFLDTNALVRIVSEGESLCRCFGALGIRCGRIAHTDEEYERMIANKRELVERAVKYPPDVLRESGDMFLVAAADSGCRDAAAVQRMFAATFVPPREIGGVSIGSFKWHELQNAARQGAANESRKNEIQEAWCAVRPYEKPAASLEHDSALHEAAEFHRKSVPKTFVLTLDYPMLGLARRWAGKHQSPLWISLHAVVQALAVYGPGSNFDSAEFGLLLSRMIQDELHPLVGSFEVEDLAWMLEAEERTTSMPGHEATALAREVARIRLSGGDSDTVQLAIHRKFRRWSLKRDKENQNARAEIEEVQKARETDKSRTEEGKRALVEEFSKPRFRLLTILYLLVGALLVVVTLAVAASAITALSAEDRGSWWKVLGAIALALGTATVGVYWKWLVPAWRRRRDDAETYGERKASPFYP